MSSGCCFDDHASFKEKQWAIIESYIRRYGVARHQLESFEHFVENLLPYIVHEHSNVSITTSSGAEHTVSLCNMSVMRPTIKERHSVEKRILPHIARLRGLTYSMSVLVDVVHDIRNPVAAKSERRIYREVVLARIPCMVKTRFCNLSEETGIGEECALDPGGYFIINGSEKMLLSQEKLHTNRIYVFPVNPPSKHVLKCEVRSCHELKLRSTSTLFMYMNMSKGAVLPEFVVQLPYLEHVHMPLYAIFMLLDVNSTEAIMSCVFFDGECESELQQLLRSILESHLRTHKSSTDVFEWTGMRTRESTREKRQRYLYHLISNEFLPHLGLDHSEKTKRDKAHFLGRMVRRMMRTYMYPDAYPCDDRDDYSNKRIDVAGVLMSLLFRQHMRSVFKRMTSQMRRLDDKMQYMNASTLINSRTVTSGFHVAFATGNWGMNKGKSTQSGVAQMLARLSMLSTLACLRKLNTPINRDGKAPKPRMLHATSWGIICPAETPEGGSCGLVKNLAILCHVRIGTPSSLIVDHINHHADITCLVKSVDEVALSPTAVAVWCVILVNGTIGGMVVRERAQELVVRLRNHRRAGMLPFDASIVYFQAEDAVLIDTDPGCLCRPLLVVSRLHDFDRVFHGGDGHSLFDRMLQAGIVEYVDKREESSLCVALSSLDLAETSADSTKFTHLELDASSINGICASLIPFSDHNQAPRNVYQSAMCKQAVSVYALNYQRRFDTVSHVLCYPQKPLVSTRIEEMLDLNRVQSGCNPIVCIMCYGGFNQEDSLIVNEGALQRGMFLSITHKTSKDEEKRHGADAQRFERPDASSCVGMRVAKYNKLADDGVVRVGETVDFGDAIIGKTISVMELGSEGRKAIKRDKATLVKVDTSVVDGVVRSLTREGQKYVRVRLRTFRQPIVGDKLCYTSDHDVLTLHGGWKPIANVKVGDTLLCLDPDTSTGKYQIVSDMHEYALHEMKDALIEIESTSASLCVTMEHRLLIAPASDVVSETNANSVAKGAQIHLVKARDVMHKLRTHAEWCMISAATMSDSLGSVPSMPPGIADTELLPWLFVYGAWRASGCLLDAATATAKARSTSAYFLRALEACSHGLKCVRKCAHGETAWVSGPMCSFMEREAASNAYHHLPHWCYELGNDASRALLAGFLDVLCGDSNACNYATEASIASGHPFCDALQQLAVHAGSAATVDNNGRMCFHRGLLNVSSSQFSARWAECGERVFCPTVPTGIIYVRRKGKPVWCGNSSRHGQKGVIGMTLPQHLMPFTCDGVTPDIIVNPHAIPSRMTIGQLMECLLGKVATARMAIGDGTPFQGTTIEGIADELFKNGYQRHGDERLFNGFTGELMPGTVFIGPTMYQRLKHMVEDKEHARARGPKVLLTRQPVEGRARDGGLRFGEMERDCFIAHGVAELLKERLHEQSDAFITHVCNTCGLLCVSGTASSIVSHKGAHCIACVDGGLPIEIRIPYACKLLLQELMAMNIAPRLRLT